MKTAIFLADGYEEIEALTVVDMLRRARITCDMISAGDEIETVGSHGIRVKADYLVSEIDFNEYECMILPGGNPGTKNLEANQYLMSKLDDFYIKGKLICAICAAPTIFAHRGYLNEKTAVCYPALESELEGASIPEEEVVKDGNIITSRGMGTSIAFAAKIIETLIDEKTAEDLLKAVVYKQY